MKFKVRCARPSSRGRVGEAYVTKWRPTQDEAKEIKEGTFIEMFNLSCGDRRSNGLANMSFTRSSKLRRIKVGPPDATSGPHQGLGLGHLMQRLDPIKV